MRPKAATKYGNLLPKVNVFHSVDHTPSKYRGLMAPINLAEQKERFLQFGISPVFVMKGSKEALARATRKPLGRIVKTYLNEAKQILENVKRIYGDGGDYIKATYGTPIDYVKASKQLADYMKESNLEGKITTYWAPDLSCSAKIMWHGPSSKYNRPEARKYTLLLNCNSDNMYLREFGMQCLANHEIGTHYMRMYNDGFQPWYSDRKCFGLRSLSSREMNATEEGLASINTLIEAKTKHLWTAALLYYTACMAETMNFCELFNHLATYVLDKELRWRHVMRVKRSLPDPSQCGGYGNDQIYFEGAVEILQNLDKIDLPVLYSGKVCWDEVNRVRRLARTEFIRMPHFIRDVESYKRKLRQIAMVNGLIKKTSTSGHPSSLSKSTFQAEDSWKRYHEAPIITSSTLSASSSCTSHGSPSPPLASSVHHKRKKSHKYAPMSSMRLKQDKSAEVLIVNEPRKKKLKEIRKTPLKDASQQNVNNNHESNSIYHDVQMPNDDKSIFTRLIHRSKSKISLEADLLMDISSESDNLSNLWSQSYSTIEEL